MNVNSGGGGALQVPGSFSAKSVEQGVNRIEFAASGSEETAYEIWRRHGDTVDWYLHSTTTASGFEDRGVTPGQYYEYKVRAVRGDSMSEFSPSAVVYGAS